MTLGKSIAYNTIIQIFGKIATISLALVSFGLMTRYLGQAGFGYYTTVYAFLAIFGILIDLGLQMTTTKLISDPKNNESQIISNALTIRLLASIIFLGLAPIIVLFFPYPRLIKIGVAAATIGFVFASLTATLTSLFQKKLIMQRVVIAEVAAKILFLALLLATVYFNWGLLGVIGATVLDSFLVIVILLYFASRSVTIKLSFEPAVWRQILNATWPIALTIALNLIYFKGDIFIMSLIRSEVEVGIYGAPYKVLEILINVAYLFLGLILPILATAAASQNWEKFKTMVQSAFNFLIIVTVPLIVGGYFVGEPLMTAIAGPDFTISGELIKILLIATGAIFIASLFGYVIVAIDKQKQMIKFYALNALISVIGYVILIAKYSYWGAAWMTVFTEMFMLLTTIYVMGQSLKFLPRLKILYPAVAAAGVMAIPLYFLANLHFAILIVAGGLVYGLAFYALTGFNKQTISEIVTIKN
ncbi:MAG: hypothetical protein A2744_02475 [Candidatus Buchananbacteria bacterium RIFCSPHIGHO2_01_FULL_44_11]|uniref:Uncharacterized protein n=1 Tax=Candidatus Buchananbacteria bacterium RIFCSPHIGHO2_01_FULL_44_11 TaxID=1797535 RepID=A0A1G1Y0H5_9BACT|nr:MAG: hypothetical protein A2744_02475 [Candidatus Buchananbacteria bacterium RIFCSPHIGHO2_01_FULL_44_11]